LTEITEQLLQRCASGDREAQREAYRRYADQVYRTALHVLGQPVDAEDALQDVFLRLFSAAPRFRGQSKVSTWLYRVTVNHCLNLLKRARSRPVALPEDAAEELVADPAQVPDQTAARREEQTTARAFLARLAERDRVILVLREIEELSYREIADVLGVAEGTVMSRLSRARERLAAVARAWTRREEVLR
jgi:RNA polymerase sigma-70 factor (ECF subfamily)